MAFGLLLRACWLLVAACLLSVPAGAVTITFDLNVNFGTEPASGSVQITLTDVALDEVKLEIDTTGLDLDGEFVKEVYLNFDGDATGLTFAYQAGSSTGPTAASPVSTGSDSFMADGDGLFDIFLEFPAAPPASRFNIDLLVVYTITGTGFDATDFNLFSTPSGGQGAFLAAAKINGTGAGPPANEGSDWLGAIPEPSTALLLSAGLLGLATAGARRRRR